MKKKLKKATALTYDQHQDMSPRVSATGKGFVAEEIIKKAKEHNVPIVEDPSLAELLGQLEINDSIPPELYEAVAEVFAFIYKMDKRVGMEQK